MNHDNVGVWDREAAPNDVDAGLDDLQKGFDFLKIGKRRVSGDLTPMLIPPLHPFDFEWPSSSPEEVSMTARPHSDQPTFQSVRPLSSSLPPTPGCNVTRDSLSTPRSLALSMAWSGFARALPSPMASAMPPLFPVIDDATLHGSEGTTSPFPPTQSLHGMMDAVSDMLRNPLQALRSSFDLLRQAYASADTTIGSPAEDAWNTADECIARIGQVVDLVAGNEFATLTQSAFMQPETSPRSSIASIAEFSPASSRASSISMPSLSRTNSYASIATRRPPPGSRVLITDDDPVIRKVLVRSLEKARLVCDVACDGIEAFAMVTGQPYSSKYSRNTSEAPLEASPSRALFDIVENSLLSSPSSPATPIHSSPPALPLPLSYDAIIMDINMPNLDGIATTRALRAAGITIPIIGLSGHARPEYRASAISAGMAEFVQKPCRWTQLLEVLADHIGTSHPPAGNAQFPSSAAPVSAPDPGAEELLTPSAENPSSSSSNHERPPVFRIPSM